MLISVIAILKNNYLQIIHSTNVSILSRNPADTAHPSAFPLELHRHDRHCQPLSMVHHSIPLEEYHTYEQLSSLWMSAVVYAHIVSYPLNNL